LIVLLLVSCAHADSDLQALLQQTLNLFTALLDAGNFTAAAMYFNPDGHLLLGGFPLVTGRSDISAKFEYFYNQGVRNTTVTSQEANFMHVGPSLQTAYDTGVWQLLSDDGKVLDNGAYVNVWSRSRDQHGWQIRDRVVVSVNPSTVKTINSNNQINAKEATPRPSDPALLKAITLTNQAMMSAFDSANIAAVANLYATNGTLFPPHSSPQTGRPAIQQTWQGVYNSGARVLELTISEVGVLESDALAYEQSAYQLTNTNGTVVDTGKYIVIWTQDNGVWELYLDCFNSDLTS